MKNSPEKLSHKIVKTWAILGLSTLCVVFIGTAYIESLEAKPEKKEKNMQVNDKVSKSEKEWKEKLTEEQFKVTRKKGTERAFTGKYWDNHEEGVYKCVCCGNPLFDSNTKFDSGTGWPSFFKPIDDKGVGEKEDNALFMKRVEEDCNK